MKNKKGSLNQKIILERLSNGLRAENWEGSERKDDTKAAFIATHESMKEQKIMGKIIVNSRTRRQIVHSTPQ